MDVIREATIRLRLETIKSKLDLPEFAPAAKAVDNYNAQVEKANRALDQHSKQAKATEVVAVNAARQEAVAVRQTTIAVDQSAASIVRRNNALLQTGNELKKVGEGTFTVIRGLTLLGVSADSDLGKVVEQVARAQAAFDLFRGSVDIIEGATKSMRSLKEATGAATVAQAVLAAGMSGIRTAIAPVVAFLGPGGALVAASAVAAGAVAAIFSGLGSKAEAETGRAKDALLRAAADATAAQIGGDRRLADSLTAEGRTAIGRAQVDVATASAIGDTAAQAAAAKRVQALIDSELSRVNRRFDEQILGAVVGQTLSESRRLDIQKSRATATGDLAEAGQSAALAAQSAISADIQARRQAARDAIERRAFLEAEGADFGDLSNPREARLSEELDAIRRLKPEQVLEQTLQEETESKKRLIEIMGRLADAEAESETRIRQIQEQVRQLDTAPR